VALDLVVQDTGDTRETPAIDVCHGLIADNAQLCIYDPQVQQDQIFRSGACHPCVSRAKSAHARRLRSLPIFLYR
jgi:UDP-N-acetyl-D-mannosaminuronate dehydrogenase